MKKKAIIFLIGIAVFAVVMIYYSFFKKDVSVKSIRYGDCIIYYEYSSSNFRNDKSNIRTHGHGKSNELMFDIAKKDLMKCLCDKYTKTKEKWLKDYIVDYVKNDKYLMHCYVENVASLYVSVDSLCKSNDILFKVDATFLELCNQYQKTHDHRLKNEILNTYQNTPGYRQLYSRMIKIDQPNIDSICKYKDLVFEPMLID